MTRTIIVSAWGSSICLRTCSAEGIRWRDSWAMEGGVAALYSDGPDAGQPDLRFCCLAANGRLRFGCWLSALNHVHRRFFLRPIPSTSFFEMRILCSPS